MSKILIFGGGQSNMTALTQERVVCDSKYLTAPRVRTWTVAWSKNFASAFGECVSVWGPPRTKRMYPFTYGQLTASREAPGFDMSMFWELDRRGHDVAYVSVSVPGQSLAVDWAPGGTIYTEAVNQWTQAVASRNAPPAAKTPDFTCFLWCQGEADDNDPTMAAAYQTNFAAFIAAVRASLSRPTLHFVVCQTSPGSGSEGMTVPNAQAAVVAGDAHASLFPYGSYDRLEPHLRNTNAGCGQYGLDLGSLIGGLAA